MYCTSSDFPMCRPTVPSAPENVSVSPVDPHRLLVHWTAPRTPNGPPDSLRYVIRWTKTQDSTVSTGKVVVRQPNSTGASTPSTGTNTGTSTSNGQLSYYVGNLEANTTYTIHVRFFF